MSRRVLITGGAGFIGSHLADTLLARGDRVRVLDCLALQVHGLEQARPHYLDDRVELIVGDVRDPGAVRRALYGVDVVYHLAAAVGVGQSMYELCNYTHTNNLGTAVLLEELIAKPVQRLVVASSMSLYGEGLYRTAAGEVVEVPARGAEALARHDWEPRDAAGQPLEPVPTPETKRPDLASIYALGKYDQERMCLMIGQAYDIPTIALRFFNVFGPRQALSNPYTGVLAIFASRLLNGNRPLIFEDGRQRRDFVSVWDIAAACRLAGEADAPAGEVFNIGSGESHTVVEIAEQMASALDRPELTPEVTGKYRVGDIRHCFADITKAREQLGYRPEHRLGEELGRLRTWFDGQTATDRVDEAAAELAARGLAR